MMHATSRYERLPNRIEFVHPPWVSQNKTSNIIKETNKNLSSWSCSGFTQYKKVRKPMEGLQHSAGVDEADKAEADVVSSTTTKEVVETNRGRGRRRGRWNCGISHNPPTHPAAQVCNLPAKTICNMPPTPNCDFKPNHD